MLLSDAVAKSFSFFEVLKELKIPQNGKAMGEIRKRVAEEGLDTSHFDSFRSSRLRKKERAIYTHCIHPECGAKHDGSYGSGKFCSSKCARGHSTYLKRSEINEKVSESLAGRPSHMKGKRVKSRNGRKTKIGEFRDGMGDTKVCLKCHKSFSFIVPKRKFCSRKCAQEGLADSIRLSIVNGTHKGWAPRTKLSFAEKYYKDQLDANGYTGKYIVNHPVSQIDLGMDRPYCYYIDFYFPESKLCVEIDGMQHMHAERIELDRTRDHYLKQSGYIIYRIPWNGIRSKPAIAKTEDDVFRLLELLNDFNNIQV